MQTVSIDELSARSSDVLERIKQQDLVVVSDNEPVAILARIEGGNVEEVEAILKRLRAQLSVLRMRRTAVANGADRMTDDEIDEEIQKARASK